MNKQPLILTLMLAGAMMLSSCAGYISHSRYGNGWSIDLGLRHDRTTPAGPEKKTRRTHTLRQKDSLPAPAIAGISESLQISSIHSEDNVQAQHITKIPEVRPVKAAVHTAKKKPVTIKKAEKISRQKSNKPQGYGTGFPWIEFSLAILLLLIVAGALWLLLVPSLAWLGAFIGATLAGASLVLALISDQDIWLEILLIAAAVAGGIWLCFIPGFLWLGWTLLALMAACSFLALFRLIFYLF